MLERLARDRTALRQRERDLQTMNTTLEAQVTRRTAALTEANHRLQQEAKERQAAEQQARRLARFPDENSNPVLRVNPDGEILYANPAAIPLLRHWEDEQRLPTDWQPRLTAATTAGRVTYEEVAVQGRWYLMAINPIPEEGYLNLYGVDITDRKRFEAELAKRNTEDALTGLPNRQVFRDRVGQALRERASDRGRAAVLLIRRSRAYRAGPTPTASSCPRSDPGPSGRGGVHRGVETFAQAEALQRMGCNDLQGFLLARPCPITQITHWLRDEAPRP